MSIDDPPRHRAQWAGAAVALVTAMWLLGIAVVVYLSLVQAMSSGTHQYGGADELGREARHMSLWLAAVTVGGPVLAAGIARTGGLFRTALVYGVLAALLAVPATVTVLDAHPGTPRTADEPARAPHACQERSGGDSHCPGG